MSLDFLVFCQSRPQLAEGDRDIGPIAVAGPRRRTDDDDWAIDTLPEFARATPGAWVMELSCRSAAGEIGDDLGYLIASHSGGGWTVCDAAEAASAAPVEIDPATVSDLLPTLQQFMADRLAAIQAVEAEQQRRARAEFERAQVADPAAIAEANDWSTL